MDQEYYLSRYINISDYIKSLKRRKSMISKEIYNRTLATHLVYDEISIHTHAPKIEFIVSDNVEAEMLIDRQIERWKARDKYFSLDSYLHCLRMNLRAF